MNQNIRNELSTLMGIGLLGYLSFAAPSPKKAPIAITIASSALALRFLPWPRESFRGRACLIAGGSRGLGLALAELLILEGARLTLLARDAAELARAEKHLRELCPDADITVIACDLTRRFELERAIDSVTSGGRPLDYYFHNAGMISVGPLESNTREDFQRALDLHLFAVVDAIEIVTPIFRSQGGGRFVNISSIGGKIAVPHLSSYSVSKFALAALSRSAGIELAADGIRVTTVYPGLMRTGSPVHAYFKGDREKEFGWFSIADSTPLISVPVKQAADAIVEGVKQGKSEIVISATAKAATLLSALLPASFDALMSVANRMLPNDKDPAEADGFASREWIDQQSWTAPLRRIREAAESRYNQNQPSAT